MVIELKPKCYTCLNLNALIDPAGLTSCPKLSSWSLKHSWSLRVAHRLRYQSEARRAWRGAPRGKADGFSLDTTLGKEITREESRPNGFSTTAAILAAHGASQARQRRGEAEWARRAARVRRCSNAKAQGRKRGGWGTWERGGELVVLQNREREGGGGWREEGDDRRAWPVGNRERERLGEAGWAWPRERRRGRCRVWAEQAKSERGGGRKKDFAIFNFKPIFKYIFKLNLNSNLLLLKTTQHQK